MSTTDAQLSARSTQHSAHPFLEPEAPDLKYLDTILPRAMACFACKFDQYEFGRADEFCQPVDKPNFARTRVPVNLRNVSQNQDNANLHIGFLNVLVYAPHNATGASSDGLTLENVVIPGHYALSDRPESVIPRPRLVYGKEVIAEGHFPLATLNPNGIPLYGAGKLDELVLPEDPKLLRMVLMGWRVGPGIDRDYSSAPRATFVVGRNKDGAEFGRVHAMHNGTPLYQMAGFLSITDPTLPIDLITRGWVLPDFDKSL